MVLLVSFRFIFLIACDEFLSLHTSHPRWKHPPRYAFNVHKYCRHRTPRFRKLIAHLRQIGWRFVGNWFDGFGWQRDSLVPETFNRKLGEFSGTLQELLVPLHVADSISSLPSGPQNDVKTSPLAAAALYDRPMPFKIGVIDKFVADHPRTAHEAKRVCQSKFTCLAKNLELKRWSEWVERFKDKYGAELIGTDVIAANRHRMTLDMAGKTYGDVFDFQGFEEDTIRAGWEPTGGYDMGTGSSKQTLMERLDWVLPEYVFAHTEGARGRAKNVVSLAIYDWFYTQKLSYSRAVRRKRNMTDISELPPAPLVDAASGMVAYPD